jgi:hypothetical protein
MASRLDFSQIRSLYIGTSASQTVPTNNLIIDGNVLIGTTTDAGLKLDVNGNGRFSGGLLYLGNYSGNPELTFQATNNSFSKINFYDNNNTEGLYIRTDGDVYGGTMTFGARWDDDEPKVVFKMFQSSAGASYDVRVGVNNGSPASIMHLAGGDGQLIIQKDNFTSIHQAYAWNTNMYFGAWYNGSNEVYGATGRGAFKIVALHDSDVSPQYIAFYGANAGTAGNTITWNTLGFAQDEDGNVGIGTTDPETKLHVVGLLQMKSSTEGGPHVYRDNDNAPDIRLYSTAGTFASPTAKADGGLLGQFHWAGYDGSAYVTGAQIWGVVDGNVNTGTMPTRLEFKTTTTSGPTLSMVIKANGNVGIGTGTVAYTRLQIQEGGNARALIQTIGTEAAGDNAGLYFKSAIHYTDAYIKGALIFRNAGVGNGIGDLILATNNTANSVNVSTDDARLWVKANGNILIGTGTDSGFKLNVNGTISAGALTITSASQTAVFNDTRTNIHTDDASFVIKNTGDTSVTTLFHRLLDLDYAGDASGVTGTYARFLTGGTERAGLGLTSDKFTITTDSLERLTIDSNGNVGISTTSPASKLQVSYTSSSTTTVDNGITILNDNGAENNFVGIRLSTYGDATGGLYPKQFIGAVRDANGAGQGDIVFLNRNAADTSVVSASDEVMRITNTAKVGIGTTSPSESSKLTISSVGEFGIDLTNTGTGGVSWQLGATNNAYGAGGGKFVLTYGNASDASVFTAVQSTGNIGIGTTAPIGPLEVYRSASGALGGHIIINNNGTAVGNETALMFGDGGINGIRAAISSTTENSPYYGDIKFKTGASVYSSLTTQMMIKGNGNVLIGTTTDVGAKLYVDGGIRAASSLTSGGLLEFTGAWSASPYNGSAWVRPPAGVGVFLVNNAISRWAGFKPNDDFVVNSDNLLVQSSTGNVGIGTASPNEKLTILGSAATTFEGAGVYNSYTYGNSDKAESRFNLGKIEGSTYQPMGAIGASPTDNTNSGNGYLSFYTRLSQSLTEKMRITTGGLVGIGTQAPTTILHVSSGNNPASSALMAASNFVISGVDGNMDLFSLDDNSTVACNIGFGRFNGTTGALIHKFGITSWANTGSTGSNTGNRLAFNYGTTADVWSNTELMSITAGGNVLIGTTTDGGYKLRVNGEIRADDDIRISNTYALVINADDNNWRIGRNTISDSGWLTGNTMQMVVFGGSTGQGYQVVNSNGTALFEIDGVAGASRFSNALGVGVNPSGTAGRIDASNDIVAFSTSDRRLKENITPIANAIDKVKALTGVEFDWKEETKHVHGYEGHDSGVIAQEVKEVMPTAIRENESGYLSVRYEKLIGLLIEANKELANRVEELEKKT